MTTSSDPLQVRTVDELKRLFPEGPPPDVSTFLVEAYQAALSDALADLDSPTKKATRARVREIKMRVGTLPDDIGGLLGLFLAQSTDDDVDETMFAKTMAVSVGLATTIYEHPRYAGPATDTPEHGEEAGRDIAKLFERITERAKLVAIGEGVNAWMWLPRDEWEDAAERYPCIRKAAAVLEQCDNESAERLRCALAPWTTAQLTDAHDLMRDKVIAQLDFVPKGDRDRLTSAVRESLRSIIERSRETACSSGDMLPLDSAFLAELEQLGPTGKEGAEKLRREIPKSVQRFGTPWYGWMPSVDPISPPSRLRHLAIAVWYDVIDPDIREQRQHSEPIRMATPLAHTINHARLSGGKSDGKNGVMVDPGRDRLVLFIDDKVLVAMNNNNNEKPVSLRKKLTGRSMRTYLAMLSIYQDCGMPMDGAFWFDGDEGLLDIMGAAKNREAKKGRIYESYPSRDRKLVASDRELFRGIRVRQVGEFEALSGDPLVDEVRRNGKTLYCQHSRLIAHHMRGDYARVPRAVLQLDAEDVPLAMGIALIARNQMLAYLKGKKLIEAPLRKWVETAGIDTDAGARKLGRMFWPREAERLTQVAEEAGIGTLSVAGEGPDAVLSLTVADALSRSYAPLLDASKAQAKARIAARVADKRKPRKLSP